MKTAVMTMFKGKDNLTYDAIRVLAVAAVVVALGLTVYTVVMKDAAFDLQAYGIGLGVLFASVGAALKLKESTEPGDSITSTTTTTATVTAAPPP